METLLMEGYTNTSWEVNKGSWAGMTMGSGMCVLPLGGYGSYSCLPSLKNTVVPDSVKCVFQGQRGKGRGKGDKLRSAHCCQFAPHLQEGKLALCVAFG